MMRKILSVKFGAGQRKEAASNDPSQHAFRSRGFSDIGWQETRFLIKCPCKRRNLRFTGSTQRINMNYDYNLPHELIAQAPMENRSDARLLVVDRQRGTLEHRHVFDLPEYLKPTDTLVVNDTKVLPARLIGVRSGTGGRWEGLFLGFGPHGVWKIIGKTRGKIQPGEEVQLNTPEGRGGFPLEFCAKTDDGEWIVKPKTELEPIAALERVGWVPIPPYIRNGRMVPADKENYQTVYAQKPGAVAAPTAGLHFTPELVERIKGLGTAIVPVTLHVGMGTFKPISVDRLEDHPMHAEWCSLTDKATKFLRKRKTDAGRIVAVGTTSVRVLESAAAATGTLEPFEGETSLFIRPPYEFKVVDALLTNFHLPMSTLLVLVRTFGGDELVRRAYDEAIREQYRFYSYGDAMLVF